MTDGESRTEWKQLLDEVLAETDHAKIELKAQELENALFIRTQEMHEYGGTDVERESIKVAIQKLLRVKVEKLGYPMDHDLLGGTGKAGESQ
jgi:hypothetical protein